MDATIHHLPPASSVFDWPAIARMADGYLDDWLALVNARYPTQQIQVLKQPSDDSAYCGWTFNIANLYGPLVVQVVAGGPLCPVSSRVNRLDLWCGPAADYDPLAAGLGVHGRISTLVVTQTGPTPLPFTSDNYPTSANWIAANSAAAPHVNDYFCCSGEVVGGEYFACGQSDASGVYRRLHFLIAREQTYGQWLVMCHAQTGWTMITGRAAAPGYRYLCRASTNGIWQQALLYDYGWPAIVNSSTFQSDVFPVLFEQALVLPSDFVVRENTQPLTTGQADGRPTDFFCSIGGNLAVLIDLS